MDSNYDSKIFGGSEEECQSSESGWTMYIGSPIDDDDDDDDVDDAKNDAEDHYKGGGDDVESDDSLVSDASSAMTLNTKEKNICHQEAKKDDVEQKKNSRKWMKMGVQKIGTPEKKKDKESTSMNAAAAQSGSKFLRMGVQKIGTPEKKKDKESTSMNAAAAQSGSKVRRHWSGGKK